MNMQTSYSQPPDMALQFHTILAALNTIIVGKESAIMKAVTCLIAGGHLLLEDIPGVGKTTLAHALAQVLGMDFNRIQCTSDMLPADILGISIYRQTTDSFEFQAGPIFSHIVLADELNRTTPRTQSALLEAMAEQQVTCDGTTRQLPSPFFVIATQNPQEQLGTFPLPESQLDRFAMCISLGYPNPSAERALLAGIDRNDLIKTQDPLLSPQQLLQAQHQAAQTHCNAEILNYIQALLEASRRLRGAGLSPRAGLTLVRCAKASAWLQQRNFVTPDDIQTLFTAVCAHRIKHLAQINSPICEHILSIVKAP